MNKCKVLFNSGIDGSCLSEKTLQIITQAGTSAGLSNITITSTLRTPERQAQAMYTNVLNNKIISYKPAGSAVQNRCIEGVKGKENKSDTIKAMVKIIEDFSVKGQRVSKHCLSLDEYKKLNVLDISYKSMPSDKNAILFIKALQDFKDVVKIIQPLDKTVKVYDTSEPAIHIEICN